MSNYSPVIGLEIHVELKTKSKMFCQCSANYFGMPPNSNTCPVCLGMPGALPVPNRKAIEWAILIGKALNCKVNNFSKFDRKHYFYPDLPKGYQISQYDQPLSVNGKLTMGVGTIHELSLRTKKTFGITRVHLEEDTGKLLHVGNETLVDFNRSGVPLVEIVTEPDFDNAEDVKKFLEELQVIIRYLDVSDADMEKGSMRLEPNISVRKVVIASEARQSKSKQIASSSSTPRNDESRKLPNYKVEVKNINSFRFVKQAIEFEVERQTGILEKGETPKQETRGFDEKKQVTYSQRSKEEAHDYRYFPEPDIPPTEFSGEYLKSLFTNFPKLPQEKLDEFVARGVKPNDAFIITRDKARMYQLETAASLVQGNDSIKISDLVNFAINRKDSIKLTPKQLYEQTKEKKQPVTTDANLLATTIEKVIGANQKVVNDYKGGKVNAIMFLVGQVMREMKGKAEAKIVTERIKNKINK